MLVHKLLSHLPSLLGKLSILAISLLTLTTSAFAGAKIFQPTKPPPKSDTAISLSPSPTNTQEVIPINSPSPSPFIIQNSKFKIQDSPTPTLNFPKITQTPTPTPNAINNTSLCLITVSGSSYDVTRLQSTHSGGNIFNCGSDMTGTYQGKHGSSVNLIQAYLYTGTPVTASPTTNREREEEDDD